MTRDQIEEYLKAAEVTQYVIVPSSEIPFSHEVLEACRANRCGKYATCWTCPPGVGEPEELKAKILSYENAAIFNCRYELEDSFDFETMMESGKITQKKLLSITDDLKKKGVDFHALGCEGCHLCEKCTYPDAPCRHQDKMYPCVESHGILVTELAENYGIEFQAGSNIVTWFSLVLYR